MCNDPPDSLFLEVGKFIFDIIRKKELDPFYGMFLKIFPVFFQAVGSSLKSSALPVIRTVVLFVPLGYLFSRFGLNWFWLAFPVTETLTSCVGFAFYHQFLTKECPKMMSGGKY
mgnify:CR=1 FL=1